MSEDNFDFDIDELESAFESDDKLENPDHEETEGEREVEEEQRQPEPVKPAYDFSYEKENYEKQIRTLSEAKDNAEKLAIESALRGFESQIDSSTGSIDRYSVELAHARDDGDTAKSIKLENKIREEYSRIDNLKGEINRYTPVLEGYKNKPYQTYTAEPSQSDRGRDLAISWAKENLHWINDPRHAQKKKFAEEKLEQMKLSGDMGKMGFWSELDGQLRDFDNPRNRMPKNMVTYNNNSTSSAKRKLDPDLVKKVAYIVKEKAGNPEMLRNPEMMKAFLKHYKKPHDEGTLKFKY